MRERKRASNNEIRGKQVPRKDNARYFVFRRFLVLVAVGLILITGLVYVIISPGREPKLALYDFDKAHVESIRHMHVAFGEEPGEQPLNRYPFTQGLEFVNATTLIESAGLYGASLVRLVDYNSGETLKYIEFPYEIFAEGVTVCDGIAYLLTWREHILIALSATTLELLGNFTVDMTGWGLATDCKRKKLYATTGNSTLFEFDIPALSSSGTDTATPLRPTRSVELRCLKETLPLLNELEYDSKKGILWGNIYGTFLIAGVSVTSGKCQALVSLRGLYYQWSEAHKALSTMHDPVNDVMNGIALHSSLGNEAMLVTGKRWPKIYVVHLRKVIYSDGMVIESWEHLIKRLPAFVKPYIVS
eukprot:GHVU01213453.1.p1 GENE.GHVU01213453.1~~GHVU01213453.1.p1  ORF type:complete len:360 (+),score=16.90 GHVU01213453.1:205-1284(+)